MSDKVEFEKKILNTKKLPESKTLLQNFKKTSDI